jgi:hypothetical protein
MRSPSISRGLRCGPVDRDAPLAEAAEATDVRGHAYGFPKIAAYDRRLRSPPTIAVYVGTMTDGAAASAGGSLRLTTARRIPLRSTTRSRT